MCKSLQLKHAKHRARVRDRHDAIVNDLDADTVFVVGEGALGYRRPGKVFVWEENTAVTAPTITFMSGPTANVCQHMIISCRLLQCWSRLAEHGVLLHLDDSSKISAEVNIASGKDATKDANVNRLLLRISTIRIIKDIKARPLLIDSVESVEANTSVATNFLIDTGAKELHCLMVDTTAIAFSIPRSLVYAKPGRLRTSVFTMSVCIMSSSNSLQNNAKTCNCETYASVSTMRRRHSSISVV